MTESDIMRKIQLFVTKEGHRVFRNNVGLFMAEKGNMVRTGLCVGSCDLIGLTNTGRFLAIEVKTKSGKLSEPQRLFIDGVNRMGGIAIVAHSVDDVIIQLKSRL